MKISRRHFVTQGAAFTAALGATQLLQPAAAQAKTLTVYSSRHYNTDNALYSSFTQQTGIKVNLLEGKDDELLERLKSEGARGPADILVTVDAGRLWRAEQMGLLANSSSSVLNQRIPGNLRHPQGKWYGFSKRARVIVYSRDRVNPSQLSTYEDLANARWKDKILVRTSTNIYNVSLIAAMIKQLGAGPTEKWCAALVKNFARSPSGNDTDQIKAVASGEGDLAICNSYYLLRLVKSKDPKDQAIARKLGMFFPNQKTWGTHVNISGAGVVNSSRNKAAAVKFLEHLSSPAAQKFFSEGNNEYPVVKGVALDPVLKRYGSFKEASLNVSIYGGNSAQAIKIADRAGWK
ncbi:MAG: Fe(3+) ABC transporter substrate-binding protein [Synechococcales cyanobacterium RM1_1_8]|nr:Fe(3+) ABC transporter substrate-binding protein [Synechococcales cyanobacterium RM1_1_8]